jgi:predicted membrane-bound spermidine synthase
MKLGSVASLRGAMPPLPLLVFVVGTGSLGAEIAAVRLLAPYFGASTIVWANTIGIVLVALSVGYWLGGRLADRHPHMRGLCLLALTAAGLLAIVPFVADPMLDIAVDALDEISAGAFIGSLVGVLVLVAIPVLLLGAVSPWAIRLAVSSVEEAGTVAGRLYALSTAGSLVGTLLSALLLIPLVGTRRTFLIFALAIALIAVAGLRPLARWALAPAAIAVLIALPVGTLKAHTEDGGRVIHEAETEYQYARVIEYPDGERTLELNEGQAQHSVCTAECEPGPGGPSRDSSVLTGDVWDGHLVLGFAGRTVPPRRVAILGNAAGTTARAYEQFFPQTRVDGVEIDGELSEIGRDYFDMNNPRLHLYHEDARPFLRRVDASYDVISVDAYRQPYIPFYLTTVEFFETVRDRLAPGGVLIVNAGHPEGQDDLEKVLTATIGDVFPHVLRDPIEDTNTLIVASERPLSAERLREAVPDLPGGLRGTALAAAGRLEEPLTGGEVYTDDKAPVEWLIDKSIVDYASGSDD